MNKRPIVAFIFARSGSKGVPNKNIRILSGKHLIGWSIIHAKSVNKIDEIIVSTDSKEIADIAIKYGALVPFMRPEYLATDEVSEYAAWQHALDFYNNNYGFYPEMMVSIPTTAPLRLSLDVENCINLYEKGGYDAVITATRTGHNPYFNMVKLNSENLAELVISGDETVIRRQDSPTVYSMTTVCYVANPNYVMKSRSLLTGRVGIVEIPQERSLDIDTLYDLRIAEHLMRDRHG